MKIYRAMLRTRKGQYWFSDVTQERELASMAMYDMAALLHTCNDSELYVQSRASDLSDWIDEFKHPLSPVASAGRQFIGKENSNG